MVNNNDLQKIYDEMKLHGMSIPVERVSIKIVEAKTILFNCFTFFLSFDNQLFKWQPEYDEVANWLENNQGRGLFLFGDCGRGKSLLIRYVIPAILLKYCGKVVKTYDMQEVNKNIDDVLARHIIGLDDIGTEDIAMNYGNKRLAVAEILDAAEKYGKLILISTNLTGDEIKKRYGERVFDRIIATTRRIEFKGTSLRK